MAYRGIPHGVAAIGPRPELQITVLASLDDGGYGHGLNNPYRYVEPNGEIACVPGTLAAWAVAEVALAAYDVYDTVRTIASAETSLLEKGIAGGLFAAGVILPGSEYSQVDDAVEQVAQRTPTDRLKEHLTTRDLDAARREITGEVVARRPDGTPFDHMQEVRDAQQGLLHRIQHINRRLGHPDILEAERSALQRELSEASRLLDLSEGYLPR